MFVTSSNGVYIVNIQSPTNPVVLGRIQGTSGYSLENIDIKENVLAVAAHTDGVLFYNISDYTNPILASNLYTENAWSVALGSNVAYIADGLQLLTIDISDIYNPIILSSLDLENASKDIDIDLASGVLYIALGSVGVSAYDISLTIPSFIDKYDTSALANRIDIFNGKVAVSDWDDVEVLSLSDESFDLVGYKSNGRRTMAIATRENHIYSAEWNSVQVFEYNPVEGPDIDISTWELNYDYTEPGTSSMLSLEIINNGSAYLDISSIYPTNNSFYMDSVPSGLNAGQSSTIDVYYNATDANASGSIRIYTNDIDENELICETNGNIDGANIGSSATDFTLDYIANGIGEFTLSNNLGKVVVLAFFSPM